MVLRTDSRRAGWRQRLLQGSWRGGNGSSAEGAEKWREFGCILKVEAAVVPGGLCVTCDRKRRPVDASYKPSLSPPTGPHEQVTPAALYLRPNLEDNMGDWSLLFQNKKFQLSDIPLS